MIIEFDIRFIDDKGIKYRWEGGSIIKMDNGRLLDLDLDKNEVKILEIKNQLTSLLNLGD